MRKRTRLSLDVDSKTARLLESLQGDFDCSQVEVVRRSLRLSRAVEDHTYAGGDVILRMPDGRETKCVIL